MCRVMRHHRQPVAGMAPILDAAPHHDEACAAAMHTESQCADLAYIHKPVIFFL